MEESLTHKMLSQIENYIENFENEKFQEKNENRNLGIIYTPNNIVDYIVSNVFRLYFEKFINSEEITKEYSNLEGNFLSAIKNQKVRDNLKEIIKNIRVLDPSCGSGRFLISIAEQLYQTYRILEPTLSSFDLKKEISTLVSQNILPSRIADKLDKKLEEKKIEINKEQSIISKKLETVTLSKPPVHAGLRSIILSFFFKLYF